MRLDQIKSLFTPRNGQDHIHATEMGTLRDNPSDNISLLSRDEHSSSTRASIHERDSGEVGLGDPQAEENGSTTTSKHWIRGVYLCAEATGILLLINLALFATAAGLSRKYPGNSGLPSWATFYHGDCTLAERLEITLHLIINVLSTGILAASNYCMQTLVAPTRDDIDQCHERREWLHVGRASLRNLLFVKRYRAGLWVVLMITATPFHLLYNSVITSIQSTSAHHIVIGPRDLDSENVLDLTTPALDKCFTSSPVNGTEQINWHEFTQEIATRNYENLSSEECSDMFGDDDDSRIKLFVLLLQNFTVADGGDRSMLQISSNSPFPFGWSDGFLTAPFSNHTDSIQDNGTVCNVQSTYDYTYSNSGDGLWSSMDAMQGCLAVKAQQNCELLYSPPLCLIVTLAIFVKAITIFIAARVNRLASPPLLTTGDAIASFVSRPESTTQNMCWMSSKNVRRGEWKKSMAFFGIVEDPAEGVSLQNIVYKRFTRQGQWMKASSAIDWVATFAISVACMVTGFFFIFGAKSSSISGPILDSDTLTRKSWGPLESVILANTPQLVITVSYYFYNSVLTNMLAAAEYSSYSLRRKPLRVTWPVKDSEQQSTYWLSIPYKYGIPLLVIYTTLHWMISQSLFYWHHIPYNVHNKPDPYYGEDKFLASSTTAVLLAIAVGFIMLCALFGLSLRKFKSTMPLAGACSAAISAACHPSKDEDLENISLGKVMWGEINASVGMGNDFDEIDDQKGHCGFTSMEAVKPSMKKLYA